MALRRWGGASWRTSMTVRPNRRSVIAGASALGALKIGGDAAAQARSAITVRIDRELANLDPAYASGPWDGNVIRVVHQRLLKQKPNSTELEPDAAAEVVQSSPTTVDFRLKPGQTFAEGFGAMTAEDVKFSFERIGLPPTDGRQPSLYRGDWVHLEGVEVTGELTGRIRLKQPRANLFDIALADIPGCIVSRKAVEARGNGYATAPVGSGPYQLAGYERQRGATLKRHATFAGSRPAFEEIAIRTISDPRTADLALRSGEIDLAVLSPAIAEPLARTQGLAVSVEPSIAYVWLGMNVEKGPLRDIRVRQAIRLGLDVDQMIAAGYSGKAPRLNTLLPPQIFGHWAEAPSYRRNVAEARRLLQEAGQTNLSFRLTVLNQPAYQAMALVAQALLREIGVAIQVDAQDGGTYWDAGAGDTGRNLDLFLLRFNGKHDPNFIMQWFVSGQIGTWNWQRWANADYDSLFDSAAAELDRDKRRGLAIEAQKLMDQSAAFVWITNEANAVVHRSWLKPAAVPGWLDWQYDSFATA
jgi:peptide/nickel transport system substrate-binding protein